MRSLAKNSLYNILYQTTGLIFPLISSIYVSRILMEDGIGKVAYAQNIASYLLRQPLWDFPLTASERSQELAREKNAKNKAFSEMFTINAISTTVFVLAYILLLATTQPFREEWGLYLCAGLRSRSIMQISAGCIRDRRTMGISRPEAQRSKSSLWQRCFSL